ncbi:hypothetical protein KFE98_16445 [bacterium SCSIO 12741]|nr:hypothetical protein KFE98_16445 [bacterium SCSIO 12741]
MGLGIFSCQSPQQPTETVEQEAELPQSGYDSIAAAKYGADAYGMKKYVMAFLKRGPNRDLDSAEAMKLQMAHLKNIGRLADEGKLAVAGPFFGNDDLRGIYIFNVETLEEAKALTETDPAIQKGSLVMELKEWYGSAGLMAVNDIHKTLSKKEVTE